MAREMKNSGIAWIGEIPKDWEVISFSQGITRMATGLNPRDNFELSKEEQYYYVTIRNFKDGRLFLDDNCDRISIDTFNIIQERSQLQKGDILFASISKDGQAYILDEEPNCWNINESVFCIRVNKDYFETKYFYYHIIDSEFYNDLRVDATGTTFQSIKQNKLRRSLLCLPSLQEQQLIANFLDEKCGEIDELVALQEKMIDELKAYKQSVITETVTKGLQPNAKMKDS
ncbi:MAG: restriction endonuclease subunit S, partial [Bacteroidaceae bacterium]|nr:restriction endonuclease subunit S [Bacteroidaceae bacterium]